MRLALLLLIACGPHPTKAPSGEGRDRGELEVTLYRDRAAVAQRLEVAIPAAATTATLRLKIAAGVDPAEIYIVDKSELIIREARSTADKRPTEDGCDEVSCVLEDYERECCQRFVRDNTEWEEDRPAPPVKETPETPLDVELVVGAPRPGKYLLVVGYDTDKITWDAAYTITTTAAHDRGQLRGALSVSNATGVPLRRARVRVVDAEQAVVRDRAAQAAAAKGNDPNSTPIPQPRELGTLDLVEGDTRIELLPDATARPLRSVLVYDPIGPGIDYAHATPVQDPNLGVVPPPPTRVLESFELERTPAMRHLPAGAVRLLERRSDGTLAMLGEARLFGPATLAAAVDAVAVGTAEGVVAKRERRELTLDNDRKRVVEEIAITVENRRAQPVQVVLREHLYRGENWAIAYWSVPDIVKEGKQQIAMRVAVPPKQSKTVLYVVVYSWGQ